MEQFMPNKVAPCIGLLSTAINMDYLVKPFQRVMPEIDLRIGRALADLGNLDQIEAAVCWHPPQGALAGLPNLRLMQSLAAGIEHMMIDSSLPREVPLCRIVDPGMAGGMKAYVAWAVSHQQRFMPAYLSSRAEQKWLEQPIVAPRKHRVGIAGLGTLGLDCATMLANIGYSVSGWSRTEKLDLPSAIKGFHGAAQLGSFLATCDTLICLLPLTNQTKGFLSAELFQQLPRGAHLINVGRGDHLVEEDLIPALDAGLLSVATLDTFSHEPLPPQHPFWADPRIVITPHIATRTEPEVIVRQTLQNLEMIKQNQVPAHQVDIKLGY
jgi:glyoxylate/hydroxypyruvate reductase A